MIEILLILFLLLFSNINISSLISSYYYKKNIYKIQSPNENFTKQLEWSDTSYYGHDWEKKNVDKVKNIGRSCFVSGAAVTYDVKQIKFLINIKNEKAFKKK